MLTQHFLCTHTSTAGLLPGWRQSPLWEPRYTQPHNFYLTLQLLCSYIGPPAAQSKYPEADLVASWGILLQIQWLRKNTHWNEWQWTYIPDGKWCWCLHHGSGLFPLLKSIIMQLFETYSYWTQARRAVLPSLSHPCSREDVPLESGPLHPFFFAHNNSAVSSSTTQRTVTVRLLAAGCWSQPMPFIQVVEASWIKEADRRTLAANSVVRSEAYLVSEQKLEIGLYCMLLIYIVFAFVDCRVLSAASFTL